MKKTVSRRLPLFLMLLGLALLLALDNAPGVPPMLLTVLRKGCIYALAAVSMNLLNGFTGLFSLGQAGFMLLGAYTYAVLTVPTESQAAVYQQYPGGGLHFSVTETLGNLLGQPGMLLGVLLCLLLAGTVAGLAAGVIGLPALRLKSDYLAVVTLGFAEILRAVVQYAGLGPVTNGSNLLYGFTSLDEFHAGAWKITTALLFLLAGSCIALIVRLLRSTYGRAFKAIRDDEIAAEAMGINLARHKRMSFVISSFFAGISGALLAMYQASVQATAFKASMTYEILLIVVIGGIGSVSGSILASFLFVGCSEWWLRFLDTETALAGFREKVVFSVLFDGGLLLVTAGVLLVRRKQGKLRRSHGERLHLDRVSGGTAALSLSLILWDAAFLISPRLKLPLLRSGFRMVVFSAVIMVIVLFFRRGMLGDRELPELLHNLRRKREEVSA